LILDVVMLREARGFDTVNEESDDFHPNSHPIFG